MKPKEIILAIVTGMLLSFLRVPCVQASNEAIEEIRTLTKAAEKGTEVLFLQVEETGVSTPLIHSQWYVDNLTKKKPKRGKLEQAYRDFGRKVLEALEETSAEILRMSDTKDREHVAKMLLDLADWFGKQPGYGNVLIFNRCQDMATVPLAYLIADLYYPVDKLDAMVLRLLSLTEELQFTAKALNTEAPEVVFMPTEGKIDDVRRPLQREWARGGQRIIGWRKNKEEKRLYAQGVEDRKRLPENLAFFCDDAPLTKASLLTTLSRWDRKEHYRFILGLGGHNIRDIKAFLLFRKKIGHFPTNPPSWWKENDSVFETPIKAAFYMAWNPYRKEYGPMEAGAARIYYTVQRNTFYDEDTRVVRKN